MAAGTANSRSSTCASVAFTIWRPSAPTATVTDPERVTVATRAPLIVTSVLPTSSPAWGCSGPETAVIESPCQLKDQFAVAAVDVGPGSVALWTNSNPAPCDVPENDPSPCSGMVYGI